MHQNHNNYQCMQTQLHLYSNQGHYTKIIRNFSQTSSGSPNEFKAKDYLAHKPSIYKTYGNPILPFWNLLILAHFLFIKLGQKPAGPSSTVTRSDLLHHVMASRLRSGRIKGTYWSLKVRLPTLHGMEQDYLAHKPTLFKLIMEPYTAFLESFDFGHFL